GARRAGARRRAGGRERRPRVRERIRRPADILPVALRAGEDGPVHRGAAPGFGYGAVKQVENSDVPRVLPFVTVAVTASPAGTAIPSPCENDLFPLPSVVIVSPPMRV